MVKKKRRMPAHIVLPNGMWRFVKRGTKTSMTTRKLKTRKRAVKRKVTHMVRRRARARSAVRRYRSAGGMTLSKGLFPVPKLLASALLGAGMASVQKRFLPQVIPMQSAAAGFVVGGVAGAVGAFASEMLLGGGVAQTGNGGLY